MSEGAQWVHDEGWVPTCSFETFPGSEEFLEPPEYCDEDVVPGTKFCAAHTDTLQEPHYGPFTACYEADRDNA